MKFNIIHTYVHTNIYALYLNKCRAPSWADYPQWMRPASPPAADPSAVPRPPSADHDAGQPHAAGR